MVVADLTGILTERPPGFSCVTRAVARHLTWFAPAAARSLGRVALAQVRWAVRCLCSCLPLVCASCTPDGPRFVLTWIDGSCPTCDRTWNLSQIRFTGRLDGWATGETWPGAQGAEDDALLQTSDGGRTWREMRDARSHAAAPSFFFLDPLHGWVSWFAFSEAESDYVERLVETSDGGRTWNRVLPSSFATLQFLDSRRGIAVARKENADTLMRTDDGGRSWTALPLSRPRHFDQVLFLDGQLGWVAGKDGQQAVVMRTTDGGRVWSESRLSDSTLDEFRDLHFADAANGWAVTWHPDGTRLFHSSDGGATWAADRDGSFQGKHHWLSVVRNVGLRATFGFFEEETQPAKPKEADAARADWAPHLLFSPDRGDHWTKFDLAHPVYDCHVFDGELICASDAFRVLVVHPSRAK